MPFGRVGRQTEDARTDQVKALTDAAGHQADGAGNDPAPGAETGEDDGAAEGEWASPPFILLSCPDTSPSPAWTPAGATYGSSTRSPSLDCTHVGWPGRS